MRAKKKPFLFTVFGERVRNVCKPKMRFGTWLVKKESGKPGFFLCLCDCGTERIISSHQLITKRTQSCGCKMTEAQIKSRFTHGKTKTRTYRIWAGMIYRVKGKKPLDALYYKGKGIAVSQRWQRFENFLKDMGECPPGLTLDRIDGDKDYTKENCRWASRQDQIRNRAVSRRATVGNETKTLSEWAEFLNLPISRLSYHWHKGQINCYLEKCLTKN